MSDWLLAEKKLQGEHVTLLPLSKAHRADLLVAASDGELWKLWVTSVPNEESIDQYIDDALAQKALGLAYPFVVLHNATQKIIGTTRYCNAEPSDQRLEIGYTWYAKSYQRSVVNTECKLLLLTHAFEVLNAIAIEFRTHWHNHASRNAIARLGAKQDGILRNHKKGKDGIYRDTVVFSIINHEWPVVRQSLQFKLLG